jgi:predicted ferric reductase
MSSLALAPGSGGLALAGLQFWLTGRFRSATAPFGMDLGYRLRRWAALGALALLSVHAMIIVSGYAAAAGGELGGTRGVSSGPAR